MRPGFDLHPQPPSLQDPQPSAKAVTTVAMQWSKAGRGECSRKGTRWSARSSRAVSRRSQRSLRAVRNSGTGESYVGKPSPEAGSARTAGRGFARRKPYNRMHLLRLLAYMKVAYTMVQSYVKSATATPWRVDSPAVNSSRKLSVARRSKLTSKAEVVARNREAVSRNIDLREITRTVPRGQDGA